MCALLRSPLADVVQVLLGLSGFLFLTFSLQKMVADYERRTSQWKFIARNANFWLGLVLLGFSVVPAIARTSKCSGFVPDQVSLGGTIDEPSRGQLQWPLRVQRDGETQVAVSEKSSLEVTEYFA